MVLGAFLTINVPVVYMGRDVWIWMGGNLQRGLFEGVGTESEIFLGPETATRAASAICAQKRQDFRAHLFKWPEKWISIRPAPSKKTGTLAILWRRDFRAHSEIVSVASTKWT